MTSDGRLELPQVTLCCIDCTPRLGWALDAMRQCLAGIAFGDAFLCTDRRMLGERQMPDGVRWVEIDALDSVEAYSHFVIKALAPHVRTSHVLVVQWDGYVLHPEAWRDDFLQFDYIGAPWPHIAAPNSVGNGGFSLRSRRLLEALADPAVVPGHPEDICICVDNRAWLETRGISFAPVALARNFAMEEGGEPGAGTFGFHGAYHLVTLLDPAATLAFVESLGPRALAAHSFGNLLRNLTTRARSDARLRPALAALERLILDAIEDLRGPRSLTPEALGLGKALIRYGQLDAARRLLAQRREALQRPWGESKLRLRLWLKRLVSAAPAGPLSTPDRPSGSR